MQLYLVDDFLSADKRMIERLKLVSPGLKILKFDGQFYRFRENDLDWALGVNVYGGDDLNQLYANFLKTPTKQYFKSNNGDFWLTGTDLVFSGLPETLLAETTEGQGYEFGHKIIEAHKTQAKRNLATHKGVPDSLVVFDPVIELVGNPAPYLKGMSQAESEWKAPPKIFMFAGNR
jgi:hypothetical protein